MAHRNQKNRRPKKKKNKTRKPFGAGMVALVQRVQNLEPSLPHKVLINPSGHEKMSEVILKFAQPMLDASDNGESTRKAINLAILAWNFAIIHERSGEKALDEIIHKTMKPDTDEAKIEEFKRYLAMLFIRKRELFPDNKRVILDYQITEARDNFHLDVVTTLPSSPEEIEKQGTLE